MEVIESVQKDSCDRPEYDGNPRRPSGERGWRAGGEACGLQSGSNVGLRKISPAEEKGLAQHLRQSIGKTIPEIQSSGMAAFSKTTEPLPRGFNLIPGDDDDLHGCSDYPFIEMKVRGLAKPGFDDHRDFKNGRRRHLHRIRPVERVDIAFTVWLIDENRHYGRGVDYHQFGKPFSS